MGGETKLKKPGGGVGGRNQRGVRGIGEDFSLRYELSTVFKLESEIEYFTGELAKVKVFGKVYNIPRQQSAYGDPGITYRYSGTTVPSKPWCPCLAKLRDLVWQYAGVRYNFVLVNR